MADFSAYPAANMPVPQTPDMLGMANSAAALNQHLVQTTGMNLDQHMTRLKTLANAGTALLAASPDGSVNPQDAQSLIMNQMKMGNITPSEAAAAYTSVPKDPAQAGQWLRAQVAGVGGNIDAITPHYQMMNTGSGTVRVQTNALGPNGASVPSSITNGISPEAGSAVESWIDPATGRTVMGTHAQHLAALGTSGAPIVSGVGQPQPMSALPVGGITQNQLAPSGPQLAQQTQNALAQMPPPAAPPQAPQAAPAAPQGAPQAAPGAGGQPMSIDPQLGTYQDANAKEYQATVSSLTGPAMQTRLDNARELQTVYKDAINGPLADKKQAVAAIAGATGFFGTQGLSDSQVFDKVSAQAAGYLPGSGASDQARMAAMSQTPHGGMTDEAIRTTSAMVLGKVAYDAQFGKDLSAWKASGGDVTNEYQQFKSAYDQTHPGPMLYAMKSMAEAGDTKGFNNLLGYIKGLQKTDPATAKIISGQIATMRDQMGAGNGGQ